MRNIRRMRTTPYTIAGPPGRWVSSMMRSGSTEPRSCPWAQSGRKYTKIAPKTRPERPPSPPTTMPISRKIERATGEGAGLANVFAVGRSAPAVSRDDDADQQEDRERDREGVGIDERVRDRVEPARDPRVRRADAEGERLVAREAHSRRQRRRPA